MNAAGARLLRFEIAYEGAATARMRAVAKRAGLEARLEAWTAAMG